ncbi:MAG: hypothetical protein ACKOLA_11765, partial [Spartobacteria bacterium]
MSTYFGIISKCDGGDVGDVGDVGDGYKKCLPARRAIRFVLGLDQNSLNLKFKPTTPLGELQAGIWYNYQQAHRA